MRSEFSPPRILRACLLLLSVLGCCLSCEGKRGLDERFEVPDGFIGEARVIYGQKGKPPIPIERGKLVYRIPRNGVLKTSTSDPNYGGHQTEYIYQPSGRVIPYRMHTPQQLPPPPDDLVVLFAGLGRFGPVEPQTGNMAEAPLVEHFTIGSKSSDELETRSAEKKYREAASEMQQALQKARMDSRVVDLLGTPISGGNMASGSVSKSGEDSGKADFTFPISGPKGVAVIHVSGTLHSGVWTYQSLLLHSRDGARRINLLEE